MVPVITDGCTKIEAPMMMPTTRAVAWTSVMDRESIARKAAAASRRRPEAERLSLAADGKMSNRSDDRLTHGTREPASGGVLPAT
jgi:hypothetical protein